MCRENSYLVAEVLVVGLLSVASLSRGAELPKPKVSVPAAGMTASQVSADGKKCIVYSSPVERDVTELTVVDMATGHAVRRQVHGTRMAGPGGIYHRLLSPDGQAYAWLDDERWLVVSRTEDGQDLYRVDLNALNVLPATYMDFFRLSDDATFCVGRNAYRGKNAWLRTEISPTPSVVATLSLSRRGNEGVLGVLMAGNGSDGRCVGLLSKKLERKLTLWDMQFQRLSQARLPATENTLLLDMRTGNFPLVLMSSENTWMLYSAEQDKLTLQRFGQVTSQGNGIEIPSGAISPDGQYLVISTFRPAPAFSIWSISTGVRVREFAHARNCHGLAFNLSGRYLSMSDGENAFVWEFSQLMEEVAQPSPSER